MVNALYSRISAALFGTAMLSSILDSFNINPPPKKALRIVISSVQWYPWNGLLQLMFKSACIKDSYELWRHLYRIILSKNLSFYFITLFWVGFYLSNNGKDKNEIRTSVLFTKYTRIAVTLHSLKIMKYSQEKLYILSTSFFSPIHPG